MMFKFLEELESKHYMELISLKYPYFAYTFCLKFTVSAKIICFNVSLGRSSNSVTNLNGSSATG